MKAVETATVQTDTTRAHVATSRAESATPATRTGKAPTPGRDHIPSSAMAKTTERETTTESARTAGQAQCGINVLRSGSNK